MVQRVLHRAQSRLGVVPAMQVIAAAKLQDNAFARHDRRLRQTIFSLTVQAENGPDPCLIA